MTPLVYGVEPCLHDRTGLDPASTLTIRMCPTHYVWVRVPRCIAWAESRSRRCLGAALTSGLCKRHSQSESRSETP